MQHPIRRWAPVAFALLTLPLASPLLAGVVIQMETTLAGADQPARLMEMAVQAGSLKLSTRAADSAPQALPDDEMIFRGDRQEILVVNHSDKSYMVIDKTVLEGLGSQIQQAMKEMEKQLAGLDPQQRAMVEKMLKGQLGAAAPGSAPALRVEKTTERATHRGYPCVRYDILRGEERTQELWVTDPSRIEGGEEIVRLFRDMAGFWSELKSSLESASAVFSQAFGSNPMEGLAEIDGFPVVARSFADGRLESETALTSMTDRTLEAASFEPPKGYKQRAMQGL